MRVVGGPDRRLRGPAPLPGAPIRFARRVSCRIRVRAGSGSDRPPGVARSVDPSFDGLPANTVTYVCDDRTRHRTGIAIGVGGSAVVMGVTGDAKPFDPSGAARPDTDMPIGRPGIRFVGG